MNQPEGSGLHIVHSHTPGDADDTASTGAVLALDVGGTHLRYALARHRRELHGSLSTQREDTQSGDPLGQIRRVVLGAHEAVPLAQVVIGLPGVVYGGQLYDAPNLSALQDAAALHTLGEILPCPVTFMNDGNLAALGEGGDDLAFVAIGTGLGCGLVRGGQVMAGAHGQAGELGLLPLPDGSVLEDLLSGPGLRRRFAWYGGAGDALTSQTAAGQRVRDDLAYALEYLLRVLTLAFDPRQIVFGGGLGLKLGPLIDRAWQAAQRHLSHIPCPTLSQHGDNAALIGGLRLGLQQKGAAHG